MAIRRACSYQATFQTPAAPANYSAILVTIQQDGQNLISKDLSQLTIEDDTVILKLNQEETAQLAPGPALIQIRCFASEFDAPGSGLFGVEVLQSLDDQILS